MIFTQTILRVWLLDSIFVSKIHKQLLSFSLKSSLHIGQLFIDFAHVDKHLI
jgi:hypothetical protein